MFRIGNDQRKWKVTSSIALTTFFTVVIVLAIAINSIASPGTRSVNANCNSCHNSSFYLSADIQSIDAPSTVIKKNQVTVNVTVKVSGSHKSSTYTGFAMDVWLVSSTGRTSTGAHQILNGQSLSGSSAPFTWQKVFTFTVTGVSSGPDTINAKAKMSPRHESPPVTDTDPFTMEVLNSPPVLTYGGVNPSNGSDTDTYSYNINFTDPDGDLPSYIKVLVDSERQYNLNLLPGGDGSTKNGEDYGVSGVVLAAGSHVFSFETSDGSEPVFFPIGIELPGPIVTHANSHPRLESGRVSPLAGSPDDEFTFNVVYFDEEGDPPLYGVKLLLDGGLGTETMDQDMGASLPYSDGNFENGEAFTTRISLPLGEHDFTFNASDGTDSVELGPFVGPLVSIDPVMKAFITSPFEGQVFFDNESIAFTGNIDSNMNVTDANYTWTSNRSGLLGYGNGLLVLLEKGHHSITMTATSAQHDLSAASTINITVKAWEKPPYIPAILGYQPADNVAINEMEELEFSVALNPDHPVISVGGFKEFKWFVDSNSTGSNLPYFNFNPDLNGSGEHLICSIVIVGTETYNHCWNVTVKNLAVPILLKGSILDDLGDIFQGDVLNVDLPLEDPYGRALSVTWEVDGVKVQGDSLMMDLLITGGPWAEEGDHLLVARVTNPDAVLMVIDMSYRVVLIDPDVDDDNDEDDSDDEEAVSRRLFKDPTRVVIIILGALGILFGLAYAVYAVIAPVEKRKWEVIEE